MRKIGGLLGRSPWGPLYEHMVKASECAERLMGLMDAFCRGDRQEVSEIGQQIIELEHEADQIKSDIRSHLSRSLLSSLDRADALALLQEQDPIADRCEEVARWMMARTTRVPDAVGTSLRDLAGNALDTVRQSGAIVQKLRDMSEMDPLEEDRQLLHDDIDRLHRVDQVAERQVQDLEAAIFRHESEMDPTSLWLLLQIGEAIGRVPHHAVNVVEAALRLRSE